MKTFSKHLFKIFSCLAIGLVVVFSRDLPFFERNAKEIIHSMTKAKRLLQSIPTTSQDAVGLRKCIEEKVKQKLPVNALPQQGPKGEKIILGKHASGAPHRKSQLQKNDLRYQGPTHVYQIVNAETGEIWKIGESAQGLNKLGQSKRAEAQVKKLGRLYGHRFESKILENHLGKTASRTRETALIKEFRAAGHKLPGNKGNH
ncbi:hypothetical protein AGMMS49949_06160 [Alphaproteobacteria bacterium]|nr:hypothetical protein AGMMS49949_06160 [Alphaproteobacteria bacterium]